VSLFLKSIQDKLTAIEREAQSLPGDLDSAVTRLNQDKLRSLFSRLDQDFNKLLDRLFAPQRINAQLNHFIIQPDYPYIREITGEDLAKWRAAWKSDVRVVIGKEGVGVIAISELAREYKMTVPEIILAVEQQGYILLCWDDYQTLLDEIDSLIGEDEESGTIVGIPVTTTDSPREVKVLSKNSSRIWDNPRPG